MTESSPEAPVPCPPEQSRFLLLVPESIRDGDRNKFNQAGTAATIEDRFFRYQLLMACGQELEQQLGHLPN